MLRAQRKLEHIKYALKLGDGPASAAFEDIRFLHKCLPELNPADIDLSVEIFGKKLQAPFLIDAITGGTDAVAALNAKLAQTAKAAGVAMAVGSQYGAVRDGANTDSYKVIRKYNPDGVVFANISALASPQQAQAAVNMIEADAVEVHLNAAQELIMPEGDKNFKGWFANLLRIREVLDVPVIIKETGCGIAGEEYQKLLDEGFAFFDCAGSGGTNFPAIEAERAARHLPPDLLSWGVPTCWSMLDAAVCCGEQDFLIASGGIRSASQAAKSLALGADIVGITGSVLHILTYANVEEAIKYFTDLKYGVEEYMLLLGCRSAKELRRVPLIYCGQTRDFIACRGYDLVKLSKKRR